MRNRGTAAPVLAGCTRGNPLARQLHGCMRQLHHPSKEEDAMKRFRVVREIAVPVAIALCFAGLSAFSHYASVSLSV